MTAFQTKHVSRKPGRVSNPPLGFSLSLLRGLFLFPA